MNRRSPRHPGVYQRCRADCPAERCRTHRWSFEVELPPGPDGKRRRIHDGGFDSAREAAEARAEVVRQHRAGSLPTDRAKLLGAWLAEWVDGKVQRGELEESTARGYRDNIKNHIGPKLGHRKLAELRGVDLTRFYAEIARERQAEIDVAHAKNASYLAEAAKVNAERAVKGRRLVAVKRCAVPRPLSPATVARIHACMSGALKSAVKAGLIPRNVAANAELPKAERRKVRPPEPRTYGALLDALAGVRLYVLLLVAGHSGMRRGELAGMKWADLDLATGRWVLGLQRTSVGYKVIEKPAKTEAGDGRVVYLDESVLVELRTWRRQQIAERLAWGPAYVDGGYVFTRENGEPYHPDAITKQVSGLMRRAGVPGTLHTLRHFWASVLISTGNDIAAVSKAMGHANVGVTSDIYGWLYEEGRKAMAAAGAASIPRARRSA